MKAIRIHEYGDSGALKVEDVPRVSISDDQILVQVHDAGVNPIDWKIRKGHLKQVMHTSFPLTMGQDFAGEVVERGKSIKRFAIGDRLFGFGSGTYAEYTASTESTAAPMPQSMDFVTAAALPTAGLTALQLIRDHVQPNPGMTILIHGAAGGVGSFASQIAKNIGAKVIGTATGDDIEYLESLGIDDIVDYKNERFEDKADQIDAIVDLVGGDTLKRSYAVLKRGGVLVTTVQPIDESAAKKSGIRAVHMTMKRNAADLAELAALVESGAVEPRLAQTMPLDEAKKAHELSEVGNPHGKVILKVA